MVPAFVFLVGQLFLLGTTSAQCPVPCTPCKVIPDGEYEGTWNLKAEIDPHCIGKCLYQRISDGKEMCFCDPGEIGYDTCDEWWCINPFPIYDDYSPCRFEYTNETKPGICCYVFGNIFYGICLTDGSQCDDKLTGCYKEVTIENALNVEAKGQLIFHQTHLCTQAPLPYGPAAPGSNNTVISFPCNCYITDIPAEPTTPGSQPCTPFTSTPGTQTGPFTIEPNPKLPNCQVTNT